MAFWNRKDGPSPEEMENRAEFAPETQPTVEWADADDGPEVDAPAPDAAAYAERRAHPLGVAAALSSGARLVAVVVVALLLAALVGGFAALVQPTSYNTAVPDNSFAVINITGTIQNAGGGAFGMNEPSYLHADTLAYIKKLAENEGNKGILLRMNTSGGGVYESDEVYLALADYKEKTGRPVWAFMGSTCASGGVYICAAADHIVANRNTTTGSIGVYIALTDTSGLYEKLGIEAVLVRSGDNKGVGLAGVEITDAQRAVYQSMVDEYYDQFAAIVAQGRGMTLEQVRALGDGRPYTGSQALALGLVDELGNWDGALAAFEELTGAQASYPSFSRRTALGNLLGGILGALPVGDTAAQLALAEGLPAGVPMAQYIP